MWSLLVVRLKYLLWCENVDVLCSGNKLKIANELIHMCWLKTWKINSKLVINIDFSWKYFNKSTQFCSDWVFFEKNGRKSTQILYFWVFLNKTNKIIIFPLTDPNFQKMLLEGNTTIFFLWPNDGGKFLSNTQNLSDDEQTVLNLFIITNWKIFVIFGKKIPSEKSIKGVIMKSHSWEQKLGMCGKCSAFYFQYIIGMVK